MSDTADDDVELLGYTGKSGMIPISDSGSSMFYWMVNRKGGDITKDNAPLILWLEGGPGTSSLCGNFIEFGPYEVDKTGKVSLREHTWASKYHLLFIDNPLGAGYSFAVNREELVTTET
jgi:carboxypeptidase C (cathepsin A)